MSKTKPKISSFDPINYKENIFSGENKNTKPKIQSLGNIREIEKKTLPDYDTELKRVVNPNRNFYDKEWFHGQNDSS